MPAVARDPSSKVVAMAEPRWFKPSEKSAKWTNPSIPERTFCDGS